MNFYIELSTSGSIPPVKYKLSEKFYLEIQESVRNQVLRGKVERV